MDFARLVLFCNENDVEELSLFGKRANAIFPLRSQGNSLPVLSESMKGFTTITNLNLGCNMLLHSPSVLSLMKLTRLDLSGSALHTLHALCIVLTVQRQWVNKLRCTSAQSQIACSLAQQAHFISTCCCESSQS